MNESTQHSQSAIRDPQSDIQHLTSDLRPPTSEIEQIWARRAARLAEALVEEDQGEQIELVLIRLGREVYGLEAPYVFDVRPLERLTHVPRTPEWVAGVVNLRGRILSALDLRCFLGLPPAGQVDNLPYLVVVETPEMEIAVLADEVLAVESLPVSKIQDAGGAALRGGIRPEYVRGIAGYGSNGETSMLVVLDLPALLADKQLIVHEELG